MSFIELVEFWKLSEYQQLVSRQDGSMQIFSQDIEFFAIPKKLIETILRRHALI